AHARHGARLGQPPDVLGAGVDHGNGRRTLSLQGSPVDDLQAAVIRDACRHLLMRYATAVDRRDMDTLVTAFADEFVWKREGATPLRSHADIRAYFGGLYASRGTYIKRHNLTTVCIEPVDEENARGIAYAVVFTDYKFNGSYPAPMSLAELV